MNGDMAAPQCWLELLNPKHLTAVVLTEAKIKQKQKDKALKEIF